MQQIAYVPGRKTHRKLVTFSLSLQTKHPQYLHVLSFLLLHNTSLLYPSIQIVTTIVINLSQLSSFEAAAAVVRFTDKNLHETVHARC